MALCGYDGLHWYARMRPAPDRYDSALFHSTKRFDARNRVVLIGERVAPTKTIDDVIARNALVMKRTLESDYYRAACDYIRDDSNFADDAEHLGRQAKLIHSFVGVPAGCRSIVSWYAFVRLETDARRSGKLRAMRERVASCSCDIHEMCWVVWHALDGEGVARLADPPNRKMMADVVALIGYKDRHICESLTEYTK
jgi:hypothetical protein